MKRLNTKELLIELIKIPSESNNSKQVKRAINFISEYIKDNVISENLEFLNLDCKDCHNIIIKPKNVSKPKLTLYSHIDVVKADNLEQYNPIVTDDKIYGRGSGDMKCGTAIEVHTFIDQINNDPNSSIALMIVGDEEIGGINGVRYLLSEKEYRTDCVYMPDSGSGLDTIITDQKGILFLKITAKGVSSHGSRPHEGKNAILKAFEVINQLYSFFEKSDPQKYRSTVNVSQIIAGKSLNSVPDNCEFTVDIRFTEINKVNEILQFLENENDVIFETAIFDKNFHIDKNNKFLQLYQKLAQNTLESKVEFKFEHGGSDGRFFQNYQIPCIISGIKKGNTHGENVWVDLEELAQAESILKEFTQEVLKES